ncbi:hypothetical protein [Neobacillus vireti]|uniref:hypothetical protein n=1 Tax=Neobacillus vireti TaxID=220686 RepID=UPI002FFF11D8
MGKEKNRPGDPFSKLMFGDRAESMQRSRQDVPNSNQNSLDFESIVENIVKLKDSSQNLKPLFERVYPYVQQFLKKK